MKKYLCHFGAMAAVAVASAVFTGCSSDDDFLSPYEESAIQTRATNSTNAIINFDNAPADVMASDRYGNKLGESVSKVVINFEGSDSSAYGLNTPAYVAIDDIDVTVN